MDTRQEILEKLKKIEALYSGGATEGEREAARNARTRILERLSTIRETEHSIEHQFSIHDPWGRKLFIALLRRYDIRPYRRRGQKRTTVLAKMPPSFLNQTLWPQFNALNVVLIDHLSRITEEIIQEGISRDTGEAQETPDLLPG